MTTYSADLDAMFAATMLRLSSPFSVSDYALLTGTSPNTVRRWARNGELSATKEAGAWRIPRDATPTNAAFLKRSMSHGQI